MGGEEVSFNVNKDNDSKRSNRKLIIIFAVVLIVGIIIAFLIGFFARKVKSNDCERSKSMKVSDVGISEKQKQFFKKATQILSTDKLRENLKYV